MTPTSRRIIAASGALSLGLLLSGCAEEVVPTVPQIVDVEEPPTLTEGQLDNIVGQVAQVGSAAAASGKPEDLNERYTATSYDIRAKNYEVREKFEDRPKAPLAGTERLIDVVTKDAQWPRLAMVVTKETDKKAITLSVLEQVSVREAYKEIAMARLLPGKTFPSVKAAQEGAEQVDPASGDDLAISPNDAIADLSTALQEGKESEAFKKFEANKFFDTIVAEQEKELEAVTKECEDCFTYTVEHTPQPDKVWAIERADGGAVAVAVLDGNRKFKVATEGATLPLDGELKAMSGKSEVTKTLELLSTEVVVLSIPPKGSSDKVDVVGVERALMNVTAK